jgi:hypothetical protein
LQSDLELAHPDAKFVFNMEGKEIFGMVEDFQADKCDVLAVGKMDSLGDLKLMNLFCKENLVYTDSVVIENHVGFPIRNDLASGFSYWMYQAEKYHDVSVTNSEIAFNAENKREPECNVMLSEQSDEASEFDPIRVENLIFPILFFLGSATIAVLLQCYHMRLMRKQKLSGSLRRATLIGRESTMNLFARPSMRNFKFDSKLDSDEESNENTSPSPQEEDTASIRRGSMPSIVEEDSNRRSSMPSIAKGVVEEDDSVRIDGFCDNDENDPTLNGRVTFSLFGADSEDKTAHWNGAETAALTKMDDDVLGKLDDFINCYQSMKRRNRLP